MLLKKERSPSISCRFSLNTTTVELFQGSTLIFEFIFLVSYEHTVPFRHLVLCLTAKPLETHRTYHLSPDADGVSDVILAVGQLSDAVVHGDATLSWSQVLFCHLYPSQRAHCKTLDTHNTDMSTHTVSEGCTSEFNKAWRSRYDRNGNSIMLKTDSLWFWTGGFLQVSLKYLNRNENQR